MRNEAGLIFSNVNNMSSPELKKNLYSKQKLNIILFYHTTKLKVSNMIHD